mmetsp:Transcript_3943/g.6029  ORF Transcript_3943/g.6029 Transcript_3943/m.6029 type:complete len:1253 (-) Transcript_3943:27-3785(-)
MTEHDWSAHYNDDGELYYYNSKTEESAWEAPSEGFNPPSSPPPTEKISATASKWAKHTDDEGKIFFYNESTEETTWDIPDGYVEEDSETTPKEELNGVEKESKDFEMTERAKWIEHKDDEGNIYYHNEETDETRWDEPVYIKERNEEEDDGVNSGNLNSIDKWTKQIDEEGNTYYYNKETDESKWDKPDEYASEDEGAVTQPVEGVIKGQPLTDKNSDQSDLPSSPTRNELIKEEEEDQKSSDNIKNEEISDTLTKKWTKHVDDEGNVNYYNTSADETTWDKPDSYSENGKSFIKKSNSNDKKNSEELVRNESDGIDRASKEIEADETHPSSPPSMSSSPKSDKWTKQSDDDGNIYYYNETTQETTWDKPNSYQEQDPGNNLDSTGTPPMSSPLQNDALSPTKQEPSSPTVKCIWSKHQDEEGRVYYYNEKTEETQWDKPDGFIERCENFAPTSSTDTTSWSKHLDKDGRQYYYNEDTGETQWDKPDDYEVKEDAKRDQEDNKESSEEPLTSHEQKIKQGDEMAKEKEPEIDPAIKKIQDAEAVLNGTDAIMEPGCFTNVGELISGLGGQKGGQKAMQSLVTSFHGQTAVCGVLGLWLADLMATSSARNKKKEEDDKKTNQKIAKAPFQNDYHDHTDPFEKASNHVRSAVEQVVTNIAKERFTKTGGDNIFNLDRNESRFLDEMMKSSVWRRLLIDLYANHRESILLTWCLTSISKGGHHREIATRITISDHFPVYSAMLASEFAVVGNGGELQGMRDLIQDLRRTCTGTAYTALFATEVLRYLVETAKEKQKTSAETTMRRLVTSIRKWTRLREELEAAMVDPSVSAQTTEGSSVHRKRRRDFALTVSELHQRQRRRLRPPTNSDEGEIQENVNEKDPQKDALESALTKVLLLYSESKTFDNTMLDHLLEGETLGNHNIGKILTLHPLAIKGLLGHLYLPGSKRAASELTRSKCARLLALAVLSAEEATASLNSNLYENGHRSEDGNIDEDKRKAREDDLKSMLLVGSRMCELVENMVSFQIASPKELENISMSKDASTGVKLCCLAVKSAPVAQGVVLWAEKLVMESEFTTSASYPTLSPCILSLLRMTSQHHPFTRPTVLDIASSFLGHSNTEISFQKLTELKEQALRLLLFLLIQGEVVSVLGDMATRLKKPTTGPETNLDASLIRYFVGGLLDVLAPPCSPILLGALGELLMAPKCIDALKSSYFPSDKTTKLKNMIGVFRVTKKKHEKHITPAIAKAVDLMVMTYC